MPQTDTNGCISNLREGDVWIGRGEWKWRVDVDLFVLKLLRRSRNAGTASLLQASVELG
jgi:hypothetical protein